MTSIYQTYHPIPPLTGYVEAVWIQESLASEHPVPTIVLPTGRVELIFHYGDPFIQWHEEQRETMPASHIVGQRCSPITVQATGRTGIVIVRLKPCGAFPIFANTLKEISTQILDTRLVWPGHEVDQVLNALRSLNTPESRAEYVQRFLAKKVCQPDIDTLCTSAIQQMNHSWGRVRINSMASELGLGRRQFTRRFTQHVGIPPKQLSGILRAQKAVACLRSGKTVHDVVGLCGFSDQSHLIHGVYAHTGQNPSDLVCHQNDEFRQSFNATSLNSFCGLAYL